jgi:archaellum component FlaF (FlaF/FlaG flagellin family)
MPASTLSAAFALTLLVTIVHPAATARAEPDPRDCTGYPEERVWLDSQSWWITTPGQTGNNFGHIHAATCFPLQKTVSGTVHLDINITMHNNPGSMTSLTVQLFKNGSGYVGARETFADGQYTCPEGTCDWWFPMEVDTTTVPSDGTVEWRIRPRVDEPDGKTMTGSTSYQTTLSNGKRVSNYRPLDFLQGKGWYTGVEYTQARLVDDEFPYNVPTSGTWRFGAVCDSTRLPLTECLVTVDPDFHAGHKGMVLFEKFGNDTSQHDIALDLDSLSPGRHKLVIRAGTEVRAQGSTQYGILAVPFHVESAAAPPVPVEVPETVTSTNRITRGATNSHH